MKSTYKFQFKESHAYTISGVEEGLFGWISVNYLLGKFRLLPGDNGKDCVLISDLTSYNIFC